MPDLGWLSDVGKLLGAGATGWIGRVITERVKTRRMRRHLYRELAFNYDVLRRAMSALDVELLLDQPKSFARSGHLIAPYLRDLHYRDYARSVGDIETFNRLPEYHLFDMLYADIQSTVDALNAGEHATLFNRAYALKGRLEFAVLNKQLDLARLEDYPRADIAASVRMGMSEARAE